MAAATARAPAADKRWGFAAAAAASPARTPAVGAVGMAPETTILSTQRGSFPWGDRSVLPAPNPWGSSSLLSLKNDGGSGSFGNLNDRPSSRGSWSTSTDGSDLLDSPLHRGRTLQNSSTVMSHPQNTELRSGSFQFPRSQTSFSDALRGPLRNIATRRPTSHGKGFTLSADDFPVLVSKNSQSNSQQGHSFQGRPSFSSVILAAGDEQRKIPITGGNPVSTRNFSMEAQQAPLHATQAPDICMPPPCIDYWHPPPDHPPDRNGIWQEGVASYGPCKPADTPCSFTESFTQNGQSLHKQGEEARHGPVHGGYHPENNDSSYTHVPADACIKSLPHLMVRKVKDNHSDALEKQVIKKDVALLEKIKCLNIKARNLRAGNISEISSCRESKVEQPKSIDVEANVASDVPVSIVFSDITSAFVMANSVSESSNHVPTGTSNVSASANIVMIDLSEGHATKSSETIKLGESSDNNVYGVGNTSRNKHGSSAMDTASDISGPGWQEHSTVDSLPVAMTNTHGSSSIDTASDSWGPGWQEHSAADSLPGAMTKTHGSSAIDTASDSWGPGWQEHSAVDSLPVVMTNTHEDQPFTGNTTQQVHVRTADDMLNSPDYEIQNSKGELSSQHAKQLQEEEWGEIGQKAKSFVKLEDLHNPFVQSQRSNDTPGKSAEYHAYREWNASRNRHDSSAEEISSSISGNGWEDHPTVDSSSVVMANTHQDLSFSRNTSWQVHVSNADDLIISSDFEIQHSRRELCAQHAKQLQEEERGKTQQKAKSIAKLEDLNIRPLVQSQKSNDARGKSADSHEYGGWNASRNKHDVSAEDISSNNFGHGWEDHPAVDSLPVMKNSHPDQSVNWNTYQWVHAETTDVLISPGYEIEHSRCRVSSVHHAKELQKERENIQQKATSVAKLEDLNRRPFVHSQKSYDAPGKSSDYHEFGGWNASRNKHGSSAEDISFNMPGHGWDDHPTVDSFPVMTNTHQDKSFPGKTSKQRSWREFSAQHARQLQKDERVKLQQKAKANAKLVELNRSSFVQDQKSNDLPLEADKFLHKQSSGGSGTTNHDTSASDTCCTSYAENLNVLLIANGTKDTEESVAWSDDSSAQKHFQVEDTEGHVHKQESISRVLTPASDTVDANKGPLIHAIPSAKNTDINMIHIGQKGASESHDSTALIHLQMEEKRREVHSLGKSLRGPPASESSGVKKDSLIHNVMLSAKNNVINMTEHIAQKSVSESHDNSAPKHLQVDNRRQVRSQERVLRERSNIAESTENIMSVAGTLVDTQNAESKPHMGLSIQSKNQRPASPNVFGTVNTSASSVHKTHISGVVINSAIIPVQVSSVRGFTVGSIMLGNASLASVNEEKTVAKEDHDDVTNSCASPKQTKQSGRNQHRVQHVKDPHGSDSIMHTPAEEPSKKEKSDTGGLNCMVVPAPTQPSGNQSIASQNVEPAKTSEIERHAHKPAYKELDLQNPRQMLPAENHTTSSDNSSKSKLDTKSLDKEVLDATTATKSEVKTELENREDEKTSKHIGISMNGSTSAAPELNEQEANSLVLKIMKDLSDQLEQVEKQIESSTHVPTGSRSQPPRMVSLPGFTWGVDQASRSQMQYHVDGQGNMWMNYSASSYVGVNGMARAAAVPTTHLLPGISIPENNRMGGYSPPGWTWDTAECVLISDTADMLPCQGNRPTQNMYGARQMDLMHGTQALGGVAYGATGQELQQLNPVWFPSSQHDGGYHDVGTGVYFVGMNHGDGVQSHGRADYVAGPMVSADGSDYQLVPIPPPVATWTSGDAMVSAAHPAEAWVSPYREHMYYV